MANENCIYFEDAKFMFKPNFEGRAEKYNTAGSRYFNIRIDDEAIAKKLKDDKWNVREWVPRDSDNEKLYFLKVAVRYSKEYTDLNPHIYMYSGKFDVAANRYEHRVELDEDTVSQLDYADIERMDIRVRPYEWEVNSKSGIKAYVDVMHVVLREDPFANKYGNYTDTPRVEEDDGDLPF